MQYCNSCAKVTIAFHTEMFTGMIHSYTHIRNMSFILYGLKELIFPLMIFVILLLWLCTAKVGQFHTRHSPKMKKPLYVLLLVFAWFLRIKTGMFLVSLDDIADGWVLGLVLVGQLSGLQDLLQHSCRNTHTHICICIMHAFYTLV